MGKKIYITLGIILILVGWWWILSNRMDLAFFDSYEHQQRSIQMLYVHFLVLQGLGILSFIKAYKHSKKDSRLKKMREDFFIDRMASQRREQDGKIDELQREIKKLKKNDSDEEDKSGNPYVNPKK